MVPDKDDLSQEICFTKIIVRPKEFSLNFLSFLLLTIGPHDVMGGHSGLL